MSFARTKQKTLASSLTAFLIHDLEGASREPKYYWARFNELTVQDEILGILKSIDDGPTQIFCAIVPQASKQEVLEQAHGSPSRGHFGVQKTLEKLYQRYYWVQMSNDVKDWCFKCPTCNRHKTSKTNCASMQPIYTGEPFERVGMDVIGPLPRTPPGNRYILTVVDHFT